MRTAAFNRSLLTMERKKWRLVNVTECDRFYERVDLRPVRCIRRAFHLNPGRGKQASQKEGRWNRIFRLIFTEINKRKVSFLG